MRIYKTDNENYKELLIHARTLSIVQLKLALRQRSSLYDWAVNAYEKALEEKEAAKKSKQ